MTPFWLIIKKVLSRLCSRELPKGLKTEAERRQRSLELAASDAVAKNVRFTIRIPGWIVFGLL